MMRKSVLHQRYFWPFILIILGGVCSGIVMLTDRRDLTTASVILSAMVLFLTGTLLLVLSEQPSPDRRFVSLLSSQGIINLCRITADLGVAGSACFLPAKETDHNEVMQFIPVTGYRGGHLIGDSFVSGSGGSGVLVSPNGKPLKEMLARYHQLHIPQEREALGTMIQEVLVEVLEVADTAEVIWSDEGVSVSMDGYRLADGCIRIFQESPACCTMNPCPVCSFIACSLVEGFGQPVQVDRCRVTGRQNRLTIRISFHQ